MAFGAPAPAPPARDEKRKRCVGHTFSQCAKGESARQRALLVRLSVRPSEQGIGPPIGFQGGRTNCFCFHAKAEVRIHLSLNAKARVGGPRGGPGQTQSGAISRSSDGSDSLQGSQ
jgi:hypothetical protein